MEIRATTPADLRECYRIFRAAITALYGPRNLEPPDPPQQVWHEQQLHVLRHDGERCFVAESGGRMVAFVSSWQRGDAWFLASLFVDPAAQARGVGRALLERTWSRDASTRRTLTDAIQPVSNALYGRHGLIPWTPLLSFAGAARRGADEGLVAAEASESALRELDLAGYGFDRAADHAFWRERARCALWLRADTPVGYAYSWQHGQIGPLVAVDAGAAAAVLRAELARATGAVSVRAPGSASELVGAALAAGLRLSPSPGLLLLSDGTPAPRALAISGYTLF